MDNTLPKPRLQRSDSTKHYPGHFIDDPILLSKLKTLETQIECLEIILHEKREELFTLRKQSSSNSPILPHFLNIERPLLKRQVAKTFLPGEINDLLSPEGPNTTPTNSSPINMKTPLEEWKPHDNQGNLNNIFELLKTNKKDEDE
tara:strand:+ start:126 stop:563 length:438 start_codon:yes stop_codon:yes gene_type:complete